MADKKEIDYKEDNAIFKKAMWTFLVMVVVIVVIPELWDQWS